MTSWLLVLPQQIVVGEITHLAAVTFWLLGAKYLWFFSSRSLKTREKYTQYVSIKNGVYSERDDGCVN